MTLLSKEEKEKFVKDLINKNFTDKNTCFMESQIKIILKGFRWYDHMMMWFITYDENKNFDKDVYINYGLYEKEFKITFVKHNARKNDGKCYYLEVDKENIHKQFIYICKVYSNSRSQYSNNAHYDAFYEAFYDIVKKAKDIYRV